MSESPIKSTDADIYQNWGKPKLRIDTPAYGHEYADWKKSTPLDLQKIILDYMIARRIHTSNIHGISPANIAADQIKPEQYEESREKSVLTATQNIDNLHTFLKENNPSLLDNFKAAGLDGSSLYRPHLGGDIDIFLVVDSITPEMKTALKTYQKQNQQELNTDYPRLSRAGRVDFRLVQLKEVSQNLEAVRMPWIVLPHLILKNYDLPQEVYEEAKTQAFDEVRKNKSKYYDKARWLVKKKGYTWDELTKMLENEYI